PQFAPRISGAGVSAASLSPEKLVLRLRRAALLAYGLVAALGAFAIWGWAIGLPRLRDFGADFAPMAPAAALAFLLLACSYLAAERGGARARGTAWTA